MPGKAFHFAFVLTPVNRECLLEDDRDDQNGDDIRYLDHWIDGRTGSVFVGIADGIASNRRLVGGRTLSPMVAFLNIFLGVVPGTSAGGHRDCHK